MTLPRHFDRQPNQSPVGPLDTGERARLQAILDRHSGQDGALPILHDVQAEWGVIPKAAQPLIGNALGLSRAEVQAVVGCDQDRHTPAARHVLRLCRAEAYRAMGVDTPVALQLDCHQTATPVMHGDGFVRGKGRFIHTDEVASDERTGGRFPLLLATGRTLTQHDAGAQTRRTANLIWHDKDVLEIHPHDAGNRGIRDRETVRLASRAGDTTPRAKATGRAAPSVVHTTFRHPDTQANVVTDASDWATNCLEFKGNAVQVSPSNRPSKSQERYRAHAELARRVLPAAQ